MSSTHDDLGVIMKQKKSKKNIEVEIIKPFADDHNKGDVEFMNETDALNYEKESIVKIIKSYSDSHNKEDDIFENKIFNPRDNPSYSYIVFDKVNFYSDLTIKSLKAHKDYYNNKLVEIKTQLEDSRSFAKTLMGPSKTSENQHGNELAIIVRELEKNNVSVLFRSYKYIISQKEYSQKAKEYNINLQIHNNNLASSNKLKEQEDQINKNIINKYFPEFLVGNYEHISKIKDASINNNEIIVHDEFDLESTEYNPLRIIFNLKSKCFKLYTVKVGPFGPVEDIFGMFVKLKKIRRTEYDIGSMVRKKDVYVIQLQNGLNSDDEDTREFNLRNSKILELAKHIKVGTEKDQTLFKSYEFFFNWLKNNDTIKAETIISTNCYTILNNNEILLPNNSLINGKLKFNEMDNNQDEELSKFEETFNIESREQYDNNDLNKVRESFKEYLTKSYRARLTTTYSLISIFRQMLMREYKLKAFYNLALVSNKSNTGKSTIVRICCNNLLTGLDSPGNSAELLKGTTQRVTGFSYISTPLTIDDLKSITNSSTIDLLKSSATSAAGHVKKYPNNTPTIYYNLRPILASVNNFQIKDPNLADRFMLANYDNSMINKLEGEVSEDLINHLLDNMHIIRYNIWDNIKELMNELTKLKIESDRTKSNDTIFNLGNILLNKLFSILGDKSNSFSDEIGLYFDSSRGSILTSDDIIKQEIISELKRFTKLTINDKSDSEDSSKVIHTNISYDYTYLLNGELNKNTISKQIQQVASDHHLKIVIKSDKIRIGITKIALDNMKFSDFKISELSKLKDYFETSKSTGRIYGDIKEVYYIDFPTQRDSEIHNGEDDTETLNILDEVFPDE